MKKVYKKNLPVIYLLILLLVIALIPMACADEQNSEQVSDQRVPLTEEKEATTATVYYTTLDGKFLLPLNLPINATKEVAKVAMEKLITGSPDSFAADSIPEGTKLLDLYSSGSVVYVDLTDEITDIPADRAQLAIDSILLTVLPLTDGYTLHILVNGSICDNIGDVDISQPLGLPLVNVVTSGNQENSMPLVYYLSDSQAMYLVPQTIMVANSELTEKENTPVILVKKAIEALIADQSSSGILHSPLPASTKLLGVTVNDGVAILNFSDDLLNYNSGSANEVMLVNCIYYTGTSIDTVDSVQILVEGEKIETLPGGYDISQPLKINTPVNFVE